MSKVRWFRRSTRRLAEAVSTPAQSVSAGTVRRWLRRDGYSLQANRKTLAIHQSPSREAQFQLINQTKARFLSLGQPVISADAKKRELVGPFKNPGRAWHRAPVDVSAYDFLDDATGVAIPYGIYDVGTDSGFVVVGTSHGTPAFSGHAIRTWWRFQGRRLYPNATQLLLLADAGGSNTPGSKQWQIQLQYLAMESGLEITVAHYPTGASKWNPVEHRLFSFISINWAGRPLMDYDTVCNLIKHTTTGSGARCQARLDRKYWPTGREMRKKKGKTRGPQLPLNIERGPFEPRWNYVVRP